MTAGDGSPAGACAGSGRVAVAGDYGVAVAGAFGLACAGRRGVAIAATGGMAAAGEGGVVCVVWVDATGRPRLAIGHPGEDGVLPGVPYRVDGFGRLVVAS